MTIILGLGIHAIKKNKKLNSLIEESEIQLMINQYSILIVCTILRLCVDGVYLYYKVLKEDDGKERCNYDNAYGKNMKWNISMLVFEAILAHFIPIIIVQRIYQVHKKDYDLTKSLLEADQYRTDDLGLSSED